MLNLSKYFLRIAAAVFLVAAPGAHAQDYPNKPIRLIVPFGTGGATDSSARTVSERLSQRLGQTVVIENRPGAGGSIGAQYVATMPPDGYTLLLGLDATLVVNPFTQANIAFNTVRDFAPVTKLGDVGLILVANPALPAKNLAELLRYSKANPNKLSFSTGGAGSTTHVAGELLKQRTGLDMTHIPYKSGGLAVLDAVAGQVQLSYSAIAGANTNVRAGRLVGIGVSSLKRSPSLPDVPTFIEQGLPDFEAVSWVGILAPANTPRPIVDRLYAEISAVLKEPGIRERFSVLGIDPVGNTAAEFAAQIKADLNRWQAVVERGKIKAE